MPTEGVIVISVPDQDGVREACDRIALPAVAIDDTSRKVRFPTISARNRAGARAAVEHLIAQGRRSIALLLADLGDPPSEWGDGLFIDERELGYREALAAHGIPIDESLVITCAEPFDEAREGWPELAAALDRGLEIDAVFCMADLMAAPTLRTLRAHGLRVPDDVALIGFDDERAAVLVDPQLSTMRQPYAEMGRLAVELLLRGIRGEELDERRYELDAQFVERASIIGTPSGVDVR